MSIRLTWRLAAIGVAAVVVLGWEPTAGAWIAGQDAAPKLTTQQEEDLRFLLPILQADATDTETRGEAASRLLRMRVQDAYAALDAALRSGDSRLVRAVATAMAQEAIPPAALLDATIAALRGANRPLLDQLAMVLAKYEDAARVRLAAIALDRAAPASDRQAAIYALGAFATRESGDRLLEIANPARNEDEAIRAAAFDSLRRLAPLDLGNDYQQWNEWWQSARRKSREEWARDLARHYQDRSAQLEQSNRDVTARYVELLRELYRTLDVEPDQLERLPRDLNDPLAAVREFAMDRTARLLRDSVRIPEPVRERLIGCLDDPVPALRLQAARLLDELNEPNLGTLIAARLAAETKQPTRLGYLEILMERPSPDAFETLMNWLDDGAMCAYAARTLWPLVRGNLLNEVQRESVRDRMRAWLASAPPDAGAATSSTPARIEAARMLAYLGTDEDIATLTPHLDGKDAAQRTAVAQGFASRGLLEPLLTRSAKEGMYAFAIDALLNQPTTLPVFEQLAKLTPSEADIALWADAIRTCASHLPPDQLLAADDVLARTPHADARLRSVVLTRAALLPPDTFSAAARNAVLERLCPLLLETGDGLRAFELLETANGAASNGELKPLKFRAAIHAGRFNAAAQLQPAPSSWVNLLTALVETHPQVAERLRDEIARRFSDQLDDEVRRAFETASDRIAPSAASAEPGDSGSSH